MGNSMFSLSRAAKMDITKNPDVIKKITAIRVSGYKISLMNQLDERDYKVILTLIKELGEKILKVNLINAKGTDTFNEARAKFIDLVNNLPQINRFEVVSYAAQLLQYYTILCDDNFISNSNFSNFNQFLSNNEQKFGTTHNNLFIAEYILILIYNELALSALSHAEVDEGIKSSDGKMRLGSLRLKSQKLIELNELIKEWTTDAPNNVFVLYLSFIYHYTSARLLEFQYEMQEEKLTEEGQLKLSGAQESHFNLAKEALESIETVIQFDKERGITHSGGLEYSFGQALLNKLPETNMDEMKKHLLSLLATHTATSETSEQ